MKTSTLKRSVIALIWLSPLIHSSLHAADEVTTQAAAQTTPIHEVTFLGFKVAEQDLNSLRKNLWEIGGFLQARSTVRQKNVDKFFPWSNLRENYYLECQYDRKGKLTSLYQLFRPQSISFNNRRSEITTTQVARTLIKQLGQPTYTKVKSWAGTGNYRAYFWEDDKMKITVDRQGSERLGNVFVLYQIKPITTYLAFE
jgi:hypothetical protein